MRVLLVQSALDFERTYPLGLAYLAGHLRRAGIDVTGFDCRLRAQADLVGLLKAQPFDWIGLAAYSTNLQHVVRTAQTVRRHQPNATLVVGGPHATLLPEHTAALTGCDHVVRGDGERPLVQLLRGEVGAGIYTPAAGRPDRAGIHTQQTLETVDFPDREVFPVASYYRNHLRGRGRWTAMITSRGCRLACRHCAAPRLSNGQHRTRRYEAIGAELDQLQTDHGIDGVYLEDDNLLLDRQWALGLFEAIARRPQSPRLELPNGVPPALLDAQIIAAMARAGVRAVAVGVESLAPADLETLNRPLDLRRLSRLVTVAHAHNIRVTAYFMLGLPGHSLSTALRTFPTLKAARFDHVHISVYRPLPGAELQWRPTPGQRLELITARDLFYLYYYARPQKLIELLDSEGWSASLLTKAFLRYLRLLGA